jgi:hypothetical protein
MENLKYTFDQVNDWIKTADQKAMILGSFNLAGFIYQLVNIKKIICGSVYTVILFFVSITATLSMLYFWFRIIYPKLSNKLKKSKIYFLHIANAYEKDQNAGIKDLQNVSSDEFKKDLASQVVINSIIAKEKYGYIQKFIWAFGVQLITLLLLLVSLV